MSREALSTVQLGALVNAVYKVFDNVVTFLLGDQGPS